MRERARAGGRRQLAALVGGGMWLGSCGGTTSYEETAGTAGRAMRPEASSSAAEMSATQSQALNPTADAGFSGVVGAASSCPVHDFAANLSTPPVWGRVFETGECCEYTHTLLLPEEIWGAFETREECEQSCRCRDRSGYSDITSLACRCSGDEADPLCAESEAEVIERVCAAGGDLRRRVGCGKIALSPPEGYQAGNVWVFDDEEGQLLGLHTFTDAISNECRVDSWEAGQPFDCAEPEEVCLVCGQPVYGQLAPCP